MAAAGSKWSRFVGWDRDDKGGEAGLKGIHWVGGVQSSINTSTLISSNLWGRVHTPRNITAHLLRGCDALALTLQKLVVDVTSIVLCSLKSAFGRDVQQMCFPFRMLRHVWMLPWLLSVPYLICKRLQMAFERQEPATQCLPGSDPESQGLAGAIGSALATL